MNPNNEILLTPDRGRGSKEFINERRGDHVGSSLADSQQNIEGNNIMFEKSKKNKRFKLEEEKEMRIQEFLAAKRKEYEKYICLDFDYQTVEEELQKMEMIDYDKVDPLRERIRINKHRKNEKNRVDENGQFIPEDEYNLQYGSDEEDQSQLENAQVIDHIQVYITPLLDNFAHIDNGLRIIPADNMDHYLLGPPKFCGSALKKLKDKWANEEVWVVIRGFYVFVYSDPKSPKPIHLLKIPLQKIAIENVKGIDKRNLSKDQVELQYFSLIEKQESSVYFFLGKTSPDQKLPKNNLFEILKHQVAIKTYYFLCGFLNMPPDQNLLRFYENDEATHLKINLETQPIENLINIHPVLKPVTEAFYYYTFMAISASKNLMMIDFSNLGLWSKFIVFFFEIMRDESVTCPLQVLKLDNNDINDEVLNSICLYLLLPQSFFMKHLSLNHADFGDSGCQILARMISDRHMKIQYCTSQEVPYYLPFEYLSLNNVRMTDQGLYNIVIHLEKVQRENQRRGIIDYEQYLELHIAQNNITEKSMSSLGSLLYSFQGMSVLNISESKQIICIQKESFFEQLKNNYSLVTLNISKIDMNVDSFRSLISLLEDNYTLQTVLISLTEIMIKEISKSKNTNLLKYFMISYNPSMIFDNIEHSHGNN